jgi:hypothetical protein
VTEDRAHEPANPDVADPLIEFHFGWESNTEQTMNRLGILVFVGALLVTGCERTTAPISAPVSDPNMAVVVNEPAVLFQFFITTCEEDVVGTGWVHVLSTETISAADDTSSMLHFNARGTGIGLTSGAKYRFNDTFKVQMHMNAPLPAIADFQDVLNLIGLGGTADLHIRTTIRVTVNANGEIVVAVNDVKQRCG